MRRSIRLSALAQNDLIAIWEYSVLEWDVPHADMYLDELDQRVRSLARNPKLGVARDYVRQGYRTLFVNRHAVYYTVSASSIHIARVLHGQMDPSRHL